MKFLFDLDGTVTSQETLPVIANHFKCQEEIAELTKKTIAGNVPFVESFIRRVNILGKYSVKETKIFYKDGTEKDVDVAATEGVITNEVEKVQIHASKKWKDQNLFKNTLEKSSVFFLE